METLDSTLKELNISKPVYGAVKKDTIGIVNKVLESKKKFYLSEDFPFIQVRDGYMTYQAQIMNAYLRSIGYHWIKASLIDTSKYTNKKVRKNRNILVKYDNLLNGKL